MCDFLILDDKGNVLDVIQDFTSDKAPKNGQYKGKASQSMDKNAMKKVKAIAVFCNPEKA